MGQPIDISVRLHAHMPTWPNSAGFRLERTLGFAIGDDVNVSRLDMDVHCGTHVEAPLHFLADGQPLEAFPLDLFLGEAHVAYLPDTSAISAADLERVGVPDGTERLLLRTANSELWRRGPQPFRTDYIALLPEAATWIAARGIRLVGIDYLSIQRYGDDPETHRILMRAGVAILEGLDLSDVDAGRYRLHALPLRLAGAEAAPVRAVLETIP